MKRVADVNMFYANNILNHRELKKVVGIRRRKGSVQQTIFVLYNRLIVTILPQYGSIINIIFTKRPYIL